MPKYPERNTLRLLQVNPKQTKESFRKSPVTKELPNEPKAQYKCGLIYI